MDGARSSEAVLLMRRDQTWMLSGKMRSRRLGIWPEEREGLGSGRGGRGGRGRVGRGGRGGRGRGGRLAKGKSTSRSKAGKVGVEAAEDDSSSSRLVVSPTAYPTYRSTRIIPGTYRGVQESISRKRDHPYFPR